MTSPKTPSAWFLTRALTMVEVAALVSLWWLVDARSAFVGTCLAVGPVGLSVAAWTPQNPPSEVPRGG